MTTIVTRSGKAAPLTNTELDANFTNLNTDKLEKGSNLSDLQSISQARTNLGLGDLAIQNFDKIMLNSVPAQEILQEFYTDSTR